MAAQRVEKTKHAGIYRVHERGCMSAACRCSRYQATAYSSTDAKLLRKHCATLGEAKVWRAETQTALRRGALRAPTSTTVAQAAEALIAGMKSGAILDRSGKRYKPATIRAYETAMRLRATPALGQRRVSDVRRADVQALVEQWTAEGLSPSTVQNTLNPLQVIFRRAVHAGQCSIDPTDGLMLPAVRGRRDRIVGPEVAQALIDALPESERALWAVAFYGGLRRGELRALRWADVDFDAGVIRVARGWDNQAGEQDVKSDAGRRVVPLAGTVRRLLAAHKLATGRTAGDLVFGRTATEPFALSTTRRRALTAWEAAGLEAITPHEARHCAASYLIAAGLNPKQLSVYIGHSDIRTTYNRYGHLMPGDEVAAAAQLDAFLSPAAAGAE